MPEPSEGELTATVSTAEYATTIVLLTLSVGFTLASLYLTYLARAF